MEVLLESARRLLGRPEVELQRLPGGGNNRVYRVRTSEGICILKHYYRHPSDPRDRLDAEFRFCAFAWEAGLRALPRPLGRDDGAGVGLYSELPGRRPEVSEVDAGAVAQALAFLTDLNRARHRPEAAALPPASEAAFSVPEHLRLVEGRVARLGSLEGADEGARAAQSFVARELRPAWEALRDRLARVPDGGPLRPAGRVLSPSDFGFHNALRREDGTLGFLDFEYAGWDDPAKLVGDFFTQVARPVGPEHYRGFAEGVAALGPEPEATLARIELLRPLVRLKWSCILLNAFLPLDGARRAFAQAPTAAEKAHQLAQARALLEP